MNFLRIFWELPQNLMGVLLLLWLKFTGGILTIKFRYNRFVIKTCSIGVSLGFFVFYPQSQGFPSNEEQNRRHEIGHGFQSMLLGPLYLLIVGIPSLSRNLYDRYHYMKHKRSWKNYYSGFPENWADKLGGVRFRHH